MKKLLTAVAATAFLGGVAAFIPAPASAHTSVCVGTGEAKTPNLGYPVLFAPQTGGFSLVIGGGAGLGGCVDASATLSVLTAAGTLTGNCGRSFGDGILTDGGGSHPFHYESAGSLLVVTPSLSPPVGPPTAGVANAVPVPNAGGGPNSCANGNANTFQVTGAVLNG